MDRRKFLALSALAIPQLNIQAATPEENWWETVEEVLRYTAKSEEGNLILDIELTKPSENEVSEVHDDKGELIGYSLAGKRLPERFWLGCSLLTKFSFQWDGKPIDIPKRFWSDLAGFRIQTSSVKPEAVDEKLRGRLEEFFSTLDRPRVILSADGGTALIEWGRPEECDGRSTIRWMISRSGTVLRHRHTPPHEC